MGYQREKAVQYAEKWALSRNPKYYNYDALGGDCTNFVSQCLYAGTLEMNYQKVGWYYKDANRKSPSWTGVEFLYQFLIQNENEGPRGRIIDRNQVEPGDVIQLSFDGTIYGHAVIVTSVTKNRILIAAHTINAKNRDLETYQYQKERFIHVF